MAALFYLSTIHSNVVHGRSYRDARPGEPGEMDRVEVRLDIRAANWWRAAIGQPLEEHEIPRRFYKGHAENEYVGGVQHTLPPVFTYGFLFVEDAVREVLLACGLAETALRRVELFQKDGETRIDASYSILVAPPTRESIDISASEMIEQPHAPLREFRLPSGMTDPSSRRRPKIVASNNAPDVGPLWVDPQFPKVLFASVALVEALEKAGLDRQFQFYAVEA